MHLCDDCELLPSFLQTISPRDGSLHLIPAANPIGVRCGALHYPFLAMQQIVWLPR